MATFAPNPEAVARIPRAVAYRYDALPLDLDDGVLTVALAVPGDTATLDALRTATRLRLRPLPMTRDAIRENLRVAYGESPASAAAGRDRDGEAPAVRAVEHVLAQAIAAHASDVHIEPSAAGGRVRLRVDGILRELEPIPSAMFAAFTSRLKLLAGMDIADRRQPQDGRCAIPFEQRHVDARVASVPTADGEKLVVRLLDRFAATPDLANVGMPAEMLERYRAAVHAPWGFVLATGPTGSGKTTTLYASLAELDARSRNVCSVEDPIEMRLPGVSQVQVNVRAGLTFPLVVRAFMRQDPDVVMIGEMRDTETAAVAVSAALAGQVVFATLHANDAPRTIDRLVELGVARHSLAAALTAVVAQRLVRTLCEQCRVRERIPAEFREALRTMQDAWYVAAACRACTGTGYVGRTGVYELIHVDDATRDAIATGASNVHLAQLAARNGYRAMRDDAVAKVLAGKTSFDELQRIVAWSAQR
ncbi:MAG: type pilus assembly protein PilB [Candidatus Eremiobacteraeota bacterium]|jgi:type II secretory ATPase GspE/PulE/Tfp pilus assembly ATPase PilB-like protein|nr:type pilus assembly protein PilB [Candidatus Eremiobacteraeota bacterium]